MLFPNSLYTPHVGQGSSGAGLSPRLWSRANGSVMPPDGAHKGFFIGDDFLSAGLVAATMFVSEGGAYSTYIDTSCTVAQVANESGGAIAITLDGTGANDEAWITSGLNTGTLGAISDTAGADFLTIFETRFKLSQITSGGGFIGLSEEGLAAGDTLVDTTTALASKDLLGFYVDHDSPTVLQFVYRLAGQTAVSKIANVQTLAAATWYKVGFVYDPASVPSERIRVYVDNVENGTYVTATNIAVATGSAFPDGEEMAFLAGTKNPTEAAKVMTVDWWAYYQNR